MLSRFCGGNGDLGMDIIGSTDINYVNFRIIHNLVPVRPPRFKTKFRSRILGSSRIDIDQFFLDGNSGGRPEKHRHPGICNRMRLGHESSPYKSDIEFLHLDNLL